MPYSEITKRHRSVFDPSHMSAVKNHRAPGIRDFEILKPISRGAFGQVYLAKKKGSKTYYAVKSMKKKDVLTKNMMEQVVVERDALAISSKSPYVVQLFYSFQSDEKIFLVMEYMIGGDLKSLLHNLGYFDVEMAKIYIAEVTLALEYLHKHNIYHRDIKPDNMLLSNQGHIKLTDFGLSCLTSDRKPNIIDLINTPGIMNNNNISSQKKIFWRTPGQLQSLTSNFTFSAPKSKEPSSAAPRSRLDTLDSVSSLQSTNYKFSPPKFCPGDIKNSFISTPRGTRQSSSKKNRTGITFEIHSLGIAPPQRKRSHAEIESPLDDEKENSAPQKRTRLVSHSLPDIDLPTDFQASSSPVVRFDDSVKNCNYTDRSGVFEVSRIDNVSEAQNTSDINISGVAMMTDSHLASTFYETAVTDTSHMSISVYKTPHTEPCNTSVSILNTGDHFKSPQQPSTSKIELTPSPNNAKQTPLLTPTYSRTRVSSAVIKTPVQNLQFSDASPISSPIKSSPDVKHHEKIDRTPEIYNKNTSSLKEVQSENIEKTPDFEVKQTPYRTPKSCVRGRATPMERKAIFGTPDYLAPEILLGIPHGSAVDWWALGVCFYEFLVGVPPFNDDTPELVFQHILGYDIQWPEGDEELPRVCVDAIYAMLTEDPGKRVTSVEIKKMPCFDDISWNSLDTAEAPFIPQPDDECDTGYFTARNLANHLQMSNFNT